MAFHWTMTIRLPTSRFAVLALSLALAPPAAGAQGPSHKAPASSGKTASRAAPAKSAPEAAPAAVASSTDASLVGRLEFEGGLGFAVPFESGVGTGFKLAGGAFYGVQTLMPGMILQVGGTLGWTRNGYDSPVDGSLDTVDLLPTARIRMAMNPRIFLYGDGGLGLGIVHASVTVPGLPAVPPFFAGTPSTTATSTDAALLIKLGGGVGLDLQPNLSLVLEPAFHIYVKNGSITQFTVLAGVLYRP